MIDLPRALTGSELAKLRSDNQATKLYLIVYPPPTVYTARLAAVPSTTDQVASITHNTNSGNVADILEDMTLNVGSAAGLRDYGIARFRQDGVTGVIADATTFNIGEESEINWQAGAYLTVLDEFLLWPRHIKIAPNGTTPLMDYNIPYTNENQTEGVKPFAVMGPPRVKWLRGSSVTFSFNGSNSWIVNQNIASFAWSFPGAASTTGTTTATPTATYTAAGIYRIALTVTGDNGASDTGYRYLFVIDPTAQPAWLIDQFQLDSCEGNDQSGYWSFKTTLFAQADQTTIRDRALVILIARDWYGRTQADEGSIGYVTDAENVVAWGWIDGESINWRPPYLNGKVSFEVGNTGWWLDHITGYPAGAKDIPDSQSVNKWTKFKGLTLQKAWYHWLWWRTTAHRCVDVFNVTDLNRRCSRLEAPGNQSIWQQLIQMAEKSALYRPKADHYGRLFLQIEQSLLPMADRSSIPTVMTITAQDWQDEINPERIITPPTSLLDLSGVWWDGTTPTPRFAYANGRVYKHYGLSDVRDRLYIAGSSLVDAQVRCNELCGAYLAWRNSTFPKLPIKFASNHRMFDIAPYQRLSLPIAATATILGIAETVTLVPKRIAYVWNATTSTLHTEADFQKETTPEIAVIGDTPLTPPAPPPPPVVPPIVPPIIPPTMSGNAREIWIAATAIGTDDRLVYSGDYFGGGQPTFVSVDFPGRGSDGIAAFFMSPDRSYGYLRKNAGVGDSGVGPVYVFPGSATKDPATLTSGDFTKIAGYGFTIGGVTITGVGANIGWSQLYQNKLLMEFYAGGGIRQYSQYDPVAGTWSAAVATSGLDQATRLLYHAYIRHFGGSFPPGYNHFLVSTVTGSQDGPSWIDSGNTNHSHRPWQNNIGGHRYTLRSAGSPNVNYLRDIDGAGDVITGLVDNTHIENGVVCGAYNGIQVYFMDDDGQIYKSDDGATAVSIATWGELSDNHGFVWDAASGGGGSLVVVRRSIPASGAVSRIYNRSGVIIPDADGNGDRTGNFWSLVSGGKFCPNVQLGY